MGQDYGTSSGKPQCAGSLSSTPMGMIHCPFARKTHTRTSAEQGHQQTRRRIGEMAQNADAGRASSVAALGKTAGSWAEKFLTRSPQVRNEKPGVILALSSLGLFRLVRLLRGRSQITCIGQTGDFARETGREEGAAYVVATIVGSALFALPGSIHGCPRLRLTALV
jgi:hypothetical protein